MWRYGVFAAWATAAAAVRLQALVLLPAFLVAALIDAGAARDRARLRPLVLLGAVAVARHGRGRGDRRRSPAASSRRGGCSAPTRRSATGHRSNRARRDRLACLRRRAPRARAHGARDGGARGTRARGARPRPGAARVRRGDDRLRGAARAPGGALLGRVRRPRRRALPDHDDPAARDRPLRLGLARCTPPARRPDRRRAPRWCSARRRSRSRRSPHR